MQAEILEQRPLLLERADELAKLQQLRREVEATGRGRLALIAGEAGIGKTALVRQFAEATGTLEVLSGACDALFTPRPLAPFLDIADAFGCDLPGLLDSGGRPYQVCRALVDKMRVSGPVLLLVEDLHWADEGTLDVLKLLARQLEELPALVLATFRNDQLGRMHPLRRLLGDLQRQPAVVRIDLPRLSRAAVGELAGPRRFDLDLLYERTGGNPFFVTEVLAGGGDQVPTLVRDAVLARAANLTEPARRLLEMVALLPPVAESWLIESLSPGCQTALDECLASGMLTTTAEGITFRHELARSAVAESVNPIEARQVHRQALTALARPPQGTPDVTRLSHHADGAGDARAVLDYAPQAGALASARGAHRAAAEHYARALRFQEALEPAAAGELFERHSWEHYLSDQFEPAIASARAAVESFRRTGDQRRQARALTSLSHRLRCAGFNDEANGMAKEATARLEELGPSEELALAYATEAMIAMNKGFREATQAWSARAFEMAEATGSTHALLHALNSLGTLEMLCGIESGAEKLARSLSLALELDLEEEAGRAYLNFCAAAATTRRHHDIDAWIEEGLAYCAQRGLDLWAYYLMAAQASVALERGKWDRATDLAAQVLAKTDTGLARIDPLLKLALVRARRGDPGWRPPLEEARGTALAAGELQVITPVALADAETAWLEGRSNEVLGSTDAAFGWAVRDGQRWAIAELGVWRRRAGHDDGPLDAGGPFALELAGDPAAAAAAWTALGCVYQAALAKAHTGRPELIAEAHQELLRLGARAAAAVVAQKLREAGVSSVARGPRPSTAANAAGLTRREMEVLRLVADGLGNQDIARRLFLSRKTVDHHVSAILGKLGAATRREASQSAAALGLLTAT